jgi:Putative lactococcus lactis phage r1t holin
MFTAMFWKRATERAVKSFAQSLAALLSASGLGLFNANWVQALSTAGMVALLSVLTSLASTKVGDSESPSVLPAPHASPDANTPPPAAVTVAA